MAYTYRANAFNSTPFSSCCGVASMNAQGRPDTKCHRCGQPMLYDDDGLSAVRARTPKGHCLMCGKRKGDPAISGNCHC